MGNMRSQFIGAILVFCIVMAAMYAGMKYMERGRDPAAEAYVEEAIKTVSHSWALFPALDYFSQDFVLAIGMDNIPNLLKTYSELGKAEEFGNVQVFGDSSAPDELNRIHSNYYVDVRFENGPASVQVELISKEGKYRLNSMNIFSDLLLNQSNQNPPDSAPSADRVPENDELMEFKSPK